MESAFRLRWLDPLGPVPAAERQLCRGACSQGPTEARVKGLATLMGSTCPRVPATALPGQRHSSTSADSCFWTTAPVPLLGAWGQDFHLHHPSVQQRKPGLEKLLTSRKWKEGPSTCLVAFITHSLCIERLLCALGLTPVAQALGGP